MPGAPEASSAVASTVFTCSMLGADARQAHDADVAVVAWDGSEVDERVWFGSSVSGDLLAMVVVSLPSASLVVVTSGSGGHRNTTRR